MRQNVNELKNTKNMSFENLVMVKYTDFFERVGVFFYTQNMIVFYLPIASVSQTTLSEKMYLEARLHSVLIYECPF